MINNHVSELSCLNALNIIPCLGPVRINALLEYFGSAQAAWETAADQYEQINALQGYSQTVGTLKKKIDPAREWEKLEKLKIRCTTPAFSDYPPLLKQVSCPPPIIYYTGSLQKAFSPTVAIVGSRRCTFYGKEVALSLATGLASYGIGIVSGMALGVDTAAHLGTLDSNGYTVAVLGCGLDSCYPSGNRELMKRIAASGAVVSEFPVGEKPLPKNFPRRNRIISGMSLGTIVVEATAKSGSLITAHYALEQNREVFAVPGNVGSPYSRGCHRLLKEGARLVESAADVLDELALENRYEEQLSIDFPAVDLLPVEKSALELIPYQPMHMDDIIRLTDSSAAKTSIILLNLELKRKIRQMPGKYFCRI